MPSWLAFPAIVAFAVLGGCAAPAGYPSLAPRPIEDVSLAEPAPRPVPAPTDRATADQRYAATIAKLRADDARFRRLLEDGRATIARGRDAAVGSDAWGEAQQLLSRLQAARLPVTAAVTTLDAASQAPDAQADRGLADAARRALSIARDIDGTEARSIAAATPLRS